MIVSSNNLRDYYKNKAVIVEYMRSCFNDILVHERFFHWLSITVGFKPNQLRKLLSENHPNKRKFELSSSFFQGIMTFGLRN